MLSSRFLPQFFSSPNPKFPFLSQNIPLRHMNIPRTSPEKILRKLSSNDLTLLRHGIQAPANDITGGERLPSKMLMKVTVERSSGPVQVVMPAEETVGNLIKAVVEIYAAEKRRPLLPEIDPHRFELHYSQFCLECLEEDEKLINLGSRDFFLCSKRNITANSSCYDDQYSSFAWTKLMESFLLY